MSAPILSPPYIGRHRAETVRLAHARAIAALYRVTWTTERGPQCSPAVAYEEALNRFQQVRQTLGVLAVHLVTEAQWEQAIAAHVREALAA